MKLTPHNHPNYRAHPAQFPPEYANAWGKDKYGVWIELIFSGISQRFRWIPEGDFTMGSPEGEKEREGFGKETLHQVTLTQGFWLADTACTQALWLAVMEENPSNFKDSLLQPVDSVSWLDAQRFLSRLQLERPALNIGLPSEAQWEYACRAGTTSPFSFGEMIDSKQVNYNGKHPYASARKGEYRGKTVAAKSLEANDWGLYEMHGNVWEWCLDEWESDLGKDAVSDPLTAALKSGVKTERAATETVNSHSLPAVIGAELLDNAEASSVFRVLRGGSWSSFGRLCRSAIRNYDLADNRNGNDGFRFALGQALRTAEQQKQQEASERSE